MGILKNEMAKCGVRITHLGPLGPNYSEKEWIKWLDYIPNFQLQRIDYLSSKQVTELTNNEKEELTTLRKELKMRNISKKYEDKETSVADRLEYADYTTQEHLDSIISRKLTIEEYNRAKKQIQEIVDTLSYAELEQYCELLKNNFNDLSMIDLFVLREVNRKFVLKTSKKSSKQLTYQLKKNENMRYNSVIEASKDIIC